MLWGELSSLIDVNDTASDSVVGRSSTEASSCGDCGGGQAYSALFHCIGVLKGELNSLTVVDDTASESGESAFTIPEVASVSKGAKVILPFCPKHCRSLCSAAERSAICRWFIFRLVNGFILCCWLQVAGDLVTCWLPGY